jgi:hypothetical protein
MERFLDIEEVVATASTVIPGMTDEEKLLARQWSWMAIRKIGPSSDHIKTIDIDIYDKSIEIPSDCISIIDLAIYDSHGNDIKYRYNKGGSLRTHKKDLIGNQLINIYQDDKFIHISDDASGSGLIPASARVKYYAFPLDDCNQPLIAEVHLFPVMMFIRWMWSIRNRPTSTYETSSAANDWRQALDVAKANNKTVSVLQAKEIARTWSSLIPNTNFNKY